MWSYTTYRVTGSQYTRTYLCVCVYAPLCDLRSIFNKQTGTTKIITGFYLPAVVCFLIVVVAVIATVFLLFCCFFLFDYFFCLLFESFLVVVVAFKCFFFFKRLFRFVAYSALFVSFRHLHSPSRAKAKTEALHLFSLLFVFSLSNNRRFGSGQCRGRFSKVFFRCKSGSCCD